MPTVKIQDVDLNTMLTKDPQIGELDSLPICLDKDSPFFRDMIVMIRCNNGGVDTINVGIFKGIKAGFIILSKAANVRNYGEGGIATAAGDPSICTLDLMAAPGGFSLMPMCNAQEMNPVSWEPWAEALKIHER